jgi:hypothetical protein
MAAGSKLLTRLHMGLVRRSPYDGVRDVQLEIVRVERGGPFSRPGAPRDQITRRVDPEDSFDLELQDVEPGVHVRVR